MIEKKEKIIVALSGGVDSSVAAALLAQDGYEVIGVTLRLLNKGAAGFGCCGSPEDLSIAKRSAESIGIPHYILDYTVDFERDVINYFVDSYVGGETPNPCVACNRYIKFDRLEKFARAQEATALVTGHYARILHQESTHTYRLFESVHPEKDQSYVLYNITQETLGFLKFPLGNYAKPYIRQLAKKYGLPNWDKDDSQEICFVPNRDYKGFLESKLSDSPQNVTTTKPGPIKNLKGEVLGEHQGVAFYTVGQRKGLGLSVPEPFYVISLDPITNTVVVGPDPESLSKGLRADDLNWIAGSPPASPLDGHIKIRYKHTPAPGKLKIFPTHVDVEFDQPQRAVTPGQSAVFYKWDPDICAFEVLGGGKITSTTPATLKKSKAKMASAQ